MGTDLVREILRAHKVLFTVSNEEKISKKENPGVLQGEHRLGAGTAPQGQGNSGGGREVCCSYTPPVRPCTSPPPPLRGLRGESTGDESHICMSQVRIV